MRVRGHPEAVEIAHTVIRSAAPDHGGLIFDRYGTPQFGAEPNRGAGRRVQCEDAVFRLHQAGLSQLRAPAGEAVGETVGVQQLAGAKPRLRSRQQRQQGRR